jgi:hypothetical protein
MNKGFTMFYNVFRVFPFTLFHLRDEVVGPPRAQLIHPETWCNTKSNTGVAIYEYLSTLTEHYKVTKTMGKQVKVDGRVNTSITLSDAQRRRVNSSKTDKGLTYNPESNMLIVRP